MLIIKDLCLDISDCFWLFYASKYILSKATKNISVAFTQLYSCIEDVNVSLLPNGFDSRNSDCKILSLALKYSNENSILLTSDSILAARAKDLGIITITLKEFLKRYK